MPGRGAIPKFEAEARPKRRRVLALATHEDGAAILAPLHLRHSAEGDTGSTSMDTGKTKIKVLADGTIEFKTKINNVDGETFVATHIHQGAVGIADPPSNCSSVGRRARARSSRAASRHHSQAPPARTSVPTRAVTTSTTTRRNSRTARSAASSASTQARRAGQCSPLSTPAPKFRGREERLEWRLRPLSSVGRAPPW
jgi:hypothetical protein